MGRVFVSPSFRERRGSRELTACQPALDASFCPLVLPVRRGGEIISENSYQRGSGSSVASPQQVVDGDGVLGGRQEDT